MVGTSDVLNIVNADTGTNTFDTNNDVFETINLVDGQQLADYNCYRCYIHKW